MALDVHFGDKLLAGLNVSIGIKTNAKPQVKLRFFGGTDIPHTLTRLDTELWKVRFKLPQDAKGDVEINVTAGSESKSEKKAIG